MRVIIIFIQLIMILFIGGCCNDKNKAERQIVLNDLLGHWKMDSLDKEICVLWFSPDSLIYFEDRRGRGPCYYDIDVINNINILNDDKDSIRYVNSIIYLDDSLLILKNVFYIEEIRIYKKFDRIGKRLWYYDDRK